VADKLLLELSDLDTERGGGEACDEAVQIVLRGVNVVSDKAMC
jgi:hypothetical protein